MLLTKEQKQQDLFYTEGWQTSHPTNLLGQIYRSVDFNNLDEIGILFNLIAITHIKRY